MSVGPSAVGIEPDFNMSVGPVVRAEVGIPSEYIDSIALPVPVRVERNDPQIDISLNLGMNPRADTSSYEESKITHEIPVVKIEVKQEHSESKAENVKVELDFPVLTVEVKQEEKFDSEIYGESDIDVVPIESEIILNPKQNFMEKEAIEEKKEEVIEEKKEEVVEDKKEEVIKEKREEIVEEKREEIVEEKREEIVEEKREEIVEEKKEEVVEVQGEEIPQQQNISNNKEEDIEYKNPISENKEEKVENNEEDNITNQIGEAVSGTDQNQNFKIYTNSYFFDN